MVLYFLICLASACILGVLFEGMKPEEHSDAGVYFLALLVTIGLIIFYLS